MRSRFPGNDIDLKCRNANAQRHVLFAVLVSRLSEAIRTHSKGRLPAPRVGIATATHTGFEVLLVQERLPYPTCELRTLIGIHCHSAVWLTTPDGQEQGLQCQIGCKARLCRSYKESVLTPQTPRNLPNRIPVHYDLMHRIQLELVAVIACPHLGLLASKLGGKASTILGAPQSCFTSRAGGSITRWSSGSGVRKYFSFHGDTRSRDSSIKKDSSIIRMRPTHPNHVWAIDFVHDKLSNGRSYKMLTVLDEFTRQALAVKVRTKMGAEDVLEVLYPLLLRHGTPEYIRSDNGPEFAAEATQDWLRRVGIKPIRIYPGSPWETDTTSGSTEHSARRCSTRSGSQQQSRLRSSSTTGSGSIITRALIRHSICVRPSQKPY